MNKIPVDRNIPLPQVRVGRLYPFEDMQIGDSFFVIDGSVVRIHAAARQFNKRMRFTCRTRIEDGVRGVRVWRIS